MNRWWLRQEAECFWLESTDRDDLGADLNAPLYDDSGKENWRYTLLRELKPGDVIYHYHKVDQAIVSRSRVASSAVKDEVVWGARGSYAREKGTAPHKRPGLRVKLESYQELSEPITLQTIRANASLIRQSKERLEARFGKPLYSPIELSNKRPPRMLQGYLFKLPSDYLDVLGVATTEVEVPSLPEELTEGERLPEGASKQAYFGKCVRAQSRSTEEMSAALGLCLLSLWFRF